MLKRRQFVLDSMLAGVLFLMVLLMLLLNSCKHDPEVLPKPPQGSDNGTSSIACDPDSAYFQTQVLPLLVSNCAKSGCHSPEDHEDGVILNSYANVMSTGDVSPGNPGGSDIFEVLTESDPDKRMPPPPAAPFTSSQINLIFDWIAQGAVNNSCADACDTTDVTFSGDIFPLMQNSCIGCHSGANPGGLISLENYAAINTVAQNGKLLGSVSHAQGYQPMPKGGNMLPACRIDQIRIWIANGAPNN